MEASTFLNLLRSNYFRDIACLGVVKGVSDFGDQHKNEDQVSAYSTALQNTAFALKEWITHRIPRIDWEPNYGLSFILIHRILLTDVDDEPAAELISGYYENFVAWVVRSLDFDLDVVSKKDPNLNVS
jgi:hypothetical protein